MRTAGDGRSPDPAALVNEVEGHLLVEATRSEGRALARRFTDEFGWLTDSQREELERRYAEDHLTLARRSWDHTARRSVELRGEYQARYAALRRRLIAAALLGTALFGTVLAATAALLAVAVS